MPKKNWKQIQSKAWCHVPFSLFSLPPVDVPNRGMPWGLCLCLCCAACVLGLCIASAESPEAVWKLLAQQSYSPIGSLWLHHSMSRGLQRASQAILCLQSSGEKAARQKLSNKTDQIIGSCCTYILGGSWCWWLFSSESEPSLQQYSACVVVYELKLITAISCFSARLWIQARVFQSVALSSR